MSHRRVWSTVPLNPPAPPVPAPPVKVLAPTISASTLNTGTTAIATHGTYTGVIAGYSGQWYRGASLIVGATAQTYTFVQADFGLNITYQEAAINAGGSSAVGISNSLGPIIGLVLTQGTLTETSTSGTNPPTWDALMPDDLQDGDIIELYFTIDGRTPVIGTPNETHIADAREETITWTTWPSAFANGTTVKWAERYGRIDPATGLMVWSPLSNILSDFMPIPANVTGIQRGLYTLNLGFGGGPGVQNGIAIAGGDKVVLTIRYSPNGAQSITGITANSGAITFTRATATAANATEQVWYCDVAGGVTNLDLSITVSGSTQLIDFAVDELSNALAGGPSAVYTAHPTVTDTGATPFAIDGSLTIPTNGLGIYSVVGNNTHTYAGATKKAEGSADVSGNNQSVAYGTVTGAVTVSGPTFEGINIINSAWSH